MKNAVKVHAAPDTLPQAEAAAVSLRAGPGLSENTIRAYRSVWKGFCTWAESLGHEPLPASPDAVALYLEARFKAGKSAGALGLDMAAIKTFHREARKLAESTGADPEPYRRRREARGPVRTVHGTLPPDRYGR